MTNVQVGPVLALAATVALNQCQGRLSRSCAPWTSPRAKNDGNIARRSHKQLRTVAFLPPPADWFSGRREERCLHWILQRARSCGGFPSGGTLGRRPSHSHWK